MITLFDLRISRGIFLSTLGVLHVGAYARKQANTFMRFDKNI